MSETSHPAIEHLNITVKDGHNEVCFQIKRTTKFENVMDAFCQRQGRAPGSIKFFFDSDKLCSTALWMMQVIFILESFNFQVLRLHIHLSFKWKRAT
jgi:hypothetical protein